MLLINLRLVFLKRYHLESLGIGGDFDFQGKQTVETERSATHGAPIVSSAKLTHVIYTTAVY